MKTVMIVDDDEKIAYALTLRLKHAGYKVFAAYDPVLGLTTIVREKPDLILLDISMPAGGGLVMAERVMKHSSIGFIPIIIMTANSNREIRAKCEALGIKHFFNKPFDTQALLNTIQTIVNGGDPVDNENDAATQTSAQAQENK